MIASILSIAGIGLLAIMILIMISLRRVVPTNAIHIVQSGKSTVSYGKDQAAGNTYYAWPTWVPLVGVRVTVLSVAVITVQLTDYAAYDKGRVPFMIDIMAFFRINDSNVAAQRINSMSDLDAQLKGILQGVVRTILASSEIEQILEGRSQFGKMFTEEVDENLKQWGMASVKQIELMDIRDVQGSQVIANIMAKKKSLIEMESRVAVANNIQAANVAEVAANQITLLRQQEAQEAVAVRTAQKDQAQGIATQTAAQAVKAQEKVTALAQKAVDEVQAVRTAEIDRATQLVVADRSRQVAVISADASRQQTVLAAQGNLDAAKLSAQGVEIEGKAKGAAETAVLMAPVTAQITLAEKIGASPGYQQYLVSVRTIEMNQAVGIAQAAALEKADIKVIANSGEVIGGVKNVMDLLTAKGGTQLGAMLEGLKQTPAGAEVVKALTPNGNASA